MDDDEDAAATVKLKMDLAAAKLELARCRKQLKELKDPDANSHKSFIQSIKSINESMDQVIAPFISPQLTEDEAVGEPEPTQDVKSTSVSIISVRHIGPYSNSNASRINRIRSNPPPRALMDLTPPNGPTFTFNCLPDSGAGTSVIGKHLAESNGLEIIPCNGSIVNASNEQMDVSGVTKMKVKYYDNESNTEMVVSSDIDDVIIGWESLLDLQIISPTFPLPFNVRGIAAISGPSPDFIPELPPDPIPEIPPELPPPASPTPPSVPPPPNLPNVAKKWLTKYPEVFDNPEDKVLKTMKGRPMHINLLPNAKPARKPYCTKIPIYHRKPAKALFDAEVKRGVFEQVPQGCTSTWLASAHFVPKSNGEMRLVTDFTDLNKWVKRPVHPFSSVKDIKEVIPSYAKVFAVFDAKKGYWQVPLDEESRSYTNFLLPWGRYRYCRAPMGLNSSNDEFCRRSDAAIENVKDSAKIVDDILICGRDYKDLDEKVDIMLSNCKSIGLTLSANKIKVGKCVPFAGLIISDKGISMDPKQSYSLRKFPKPQNPTELKSFLGLANYLAGFAPDFASVATPLRKLTSKKTAFVWLKDHEEAFIKLKKILTSSPILGFFDPDLPSYILADASKLRGLGYVLLQPANGYTGTPLEPDKSFKGQRWKIIQCGSRALSETESRYAIIELEALAISYGILKCRRYLLGCPKFYAYTDHQPLQSIFQKREYDKSRTHRFVQRVMDYNFELKWIKGKNQTIADALSRAPLFKSNDDDENFELIEQENEIAINMISPGVLSQIKVDLVKYSNLEEAIADDDEYYEIYNIISNGVTRANIPKFLLNNVYFEEIYESWDHLSTYNGLILVKAQRIFIPLTMRYPITKALHIAHIGMNRSIAFAKQLYWWPKMNDDIRGFIANCAECRLNAPSTPDRTKPNPPPKVVNAMDEVSMDLFKAAGVDYLIMADRKSKYPFVEKLKRTDTDTVLKVIKTWFISHGWPLVIRSDNGPQFKAQFTAWCQIHGIIHTTSSAYNPTANGHAEVAVKSMKGLLQKCNYDWHDFNYALAAWRSSPSTDGKTPMDPEVINLVYQYYH